MVKKTVRPKYNVTATLHLEVGLDVEAASLEEAVAKSKSLKESDFVTIHGDYNEGSIEITSAWKNCE